MGSHRHGRPENDRILLERNFPFAGLKLLASARSAAQKIKAGGVEYKVEEATARSFEGVDFAFFSAGEAISKELAPDAARRGAVVIDNSNAFRMDEGVPLVVPEVNPDAVFDHRGIIANPNCSTIQMVLALKPLHDAAGLKRVVAATYQAVSGAGKEAVDELESSAGLTWPGKRTGRAHPIMAHRAATSSPLTRCEWHFCRRRLLQGRDENGALGRSWACRTGPHRHHGIPVANGHAIALNVELIGPGPEERRCGIRVIVT